MRAIILLLFLLISVCVLLSSSLAFTLAPLWLAGGPTAPSYQPCRRTVAPGRARERTDTSRGAGASLSNSLRVAPARNSTAGVNASIHTNPARRMAGDKLGQDEKGISGRARAGGG